MGRVSRMVMPGATVDIQRWDDHSYTEIPDGIVGAHFADDPLSCESDGTVNVLTAPRTSVNADLTNRCVDFIAPEGLNKGLEPLYLAQGLAEGIRQPYGYFLLHAAATISPEGEGHLFVGNPGYGKTVTTMALCIQQGHRLIGNDLVMMRGDSIRGQEAYGMDLLDGTKYIHIRRTAFRANPFLRTLITDIDDGDIALSSDPNSPSFMSKIRVDSEEIGIESAPEESIPLSHIWQVWLDGRSQECPRIVDQQRAAASLFFSERLARHICGTIGPILDEEGRIAALVPSFDSPGAKAQRLKAANFLGDNCRLVTGPDGSQVAALIESKKW